MFRRDSCSGLAGTVKIDLLIATKRLWDTEQFREQVQCNGSECRVFSAIDLNSRKQNWLHGYRIDNSKFWRACLTLAAFSSQFQLKR